jgi:putative FmdB family regulatory protein
MPLYEYECDACGQRFEVIQKFSDARIETCQECGKGPVRRLLSSPAIQFKGSGWYITDYAQKGKSDAAGKQDTSDRSDKADKADKSEKADTADKAGKAAKTEKAESKTEKKADTASAPASSSTPKT